MAAVAEAPLSLDVIPDPSDLSFPTETIRGEQTALVLFAAAWYGKQDAYYVARAGLRGTCVDIRPENFAEMRRLYPAGWEFIAGDVYEFVARAEGLWDVVTVDCPSGHFQRCADMVAEFCRLASRVVVLGTGVDTVVVAPRGWKVSLINRRSMRYGGVYWTVLTRA